MSSLILEEKIIDELEIKIDKYKDIEINDIESDKLDNIDQIVIDENKPSEERIIDFLCKVKNPYCFIIDGHTVKFSFSNNDVTSEECIENVMKHIISE